MTDAAKKGCCVVAPPSTRNTQQMPEIDATSHATATQQPSLKALARLALERNGVSNNRARQPLKGTQQPVSATRDLVACVAFPKRATTQHVEVGALLARIACDEGISTDLVHALTDADLSDCEGLHSEALRSYVLALRDSDLRRRGKCPKNETAPALCRMCGPVWLCPEVAALAPIVSGWPVVLGCPWCTNRAKGLPIPRPPVTCGNCRHFIRDAVNPDGGLGNCNAGHQFLSNEAMPFPNAKRQCQQFKPINSEIEQ